MGCLGEEGPRKITSKSCCRAAVKLGCSTRQLSARVRLSKPLAIRRWSEAGNALPKASARRKMRSCTHTEGAGGGSEGGGGENGGGQGGGKGGGCKGGGGRGCGEGGGSDGGGEGGGGLGKHKGSGGLSPMWSPALHLPSFHLQILYALLMLNAMTFQLLRHSSSSTFFPHDTGLG